MLEVILFLCLNVAAIQGAFNVSMEEDLRTLLFTTNKYNRFIRPTEKVIVKVYFSISSLNKLDIKDEVIEFSLYIGMTWVDSRLFWAGNNLYSSITKIKTRVRYVWTPAVIVSNSPNDLSELAKDDGTVEIHKFGHVHFQVGRIQAVTCNMDVTYYPFDTQKCSIIVNGLFSSKEEIELQFNRGTVPFIMDYFVQNGEWEYMRYSTDYQDTSILVNYTVRALLVNITFRRRPLFHIVNTLLPVSLLSFITCLIFKLPADSGEKIGFCLTVLLAFAVYLTMISENIPTSSTSTSFLSVYLIVILAVGILSVMLTIIVLRCHHIDTDTPIPKCLEHFTKCFLIPLAYVEGRACCACCSQGDTKYIERQEKGDHKRNKTKSKKKKDLSWREIGIMIDSVCFKISLFICIFMGAFTYIYMGIGYARA